MLPNQLLEVGDHSGHTAERVVALRIGEDHVARVVDAEVVERHHRDVLRVSGDEIARCAGDGVEIHAATGAYVEHVWSNRGQSRRQRVGPKEGPAVALAAAGDVTDPAKLYSAFSRLFAQLEEKDVDPINDDLVIFVRPTVFYALLEAEQVINGQYKTSEGTSVEGHIFKAWGVPVVSTANLPNGVINTTDDEGNSVGRLMGANYTGDFSKLVALAMSPRAVLAGETISLTSDVFYDKLSKSWYVDAHLAFAATPDRTEYAGAILLP